MKSKCYNQISNINKKVGGVMKLDIIGAAATAVIGVIVAFLNFVLSKQMLVKAPQKFALITVVRQIIQIGFLVIVYFIGTRLTDINVTYLLVGAVLGMTVPMLYFTKKLLGLNNMSETSVNRKEE